MKRHTSQSHRQAMGQFYTKNASTLLSDYSSFIKGKHVVDPFAGEGDLTLWAEQNGAATITKYDIEPKDSTTIKEDTIMNPVSLHGKFLLTNPPYLNANKNKNKDLYIKFSQNDLYKCHLSTIDCDEGIIILPSNFISENHDKIRNLFFNKYNIVRLDYYYYPVFSTAKTGIVTLYFTKDNSYPCREFDGYIHYPNNTVYERIRLCQKYNWLWGDEFFDFIDIPKLDIKKWTGKETGYLSNIVLGLLDHGKWKQGLSINNDNPILCKPTTFTTYQLVFENKLNMSSDDLVEKFNKEFAYYRRKYHGLFLSNYMGANQKIISRDYAHRLISKIISEA